MAEWWEQSEVVQPGADEAGAAGEWWETSEVAEDAPAAEPAGPRSIVDVLTDAFDQDAVEKTPEAIGKDTVQATKTAMNGMRQVAPGIWIPENRSIGEYITGGAEVLGTVVSSAVAEPLAGIAGIAGSVLPGPPGQGAEMVESTREALSYAPQGEVGQEMMGDVGEVLAPVGEAMGAVEGTLGEATMEATGSPALAAAAHTAPTALLELIGLGVLKKGSKAAENAARAQERLKIKPDATPEEILKEATLPEQRTYQQITDDLRAKKGAAIAEDVLPDPEIMRAADELGVDLNPSHYSTSEAYKRVEQALKSQPGSDLAAREADAITALGVKADELITDFRGEVDKSILDERVRTRLDSTIKDLGKQSEAVYAAINDKIPPATKLNTRASRAYIEKRLADLGGETSLLTTAERKLHKLMNAERPPTYAAIDTLRRDIGDAYKRQGPFKDDASATLDQVYGALITDQSGAAKAFNMGEEFAGARKMVQARKEIEQNAINLFNKEMAGSLIPKLTGAATAMTKGDVSKFKALMKALPEDMRGTAAATMLNDLFTHGARQKGSIGQGFANAYEGLNRNAGAKAELFKHLPQDAQKRFDAIGKVSTGIFRARQLENTSRTARDILQALESAGMVEKVYGKARPLAYMAGGQMAGMAADATAAAVKSGAKRVEKADALLNSPSFGRAINKAMEGKLKEAEIMLKKSAAWRAFRNTLGEGTKAQLASLGPIAWLTQQEETPVQGPQPTDQVTPPPQPAGAGLPPVGPPPEAMMGMIPGGQ